jgi:hypothetical protein
MHLHAPLIPRETLPDTPTVRLLPWPDPVVDQVGYDPRAAYVERFWLGILGPSATWLLRLLADRLDHQPDGCELDVTECASALGLGRRPGMSAAFPRTVARCCQFGAVRVTLPDTLEVRRRLPPLSRRQVSRLPDALQADHARWVTQAPPATELGLRDQARQLALTLVELGEDGGSTERQLHRWRFHPALASDAATWALTAHAARTEALAAAGAGVAGAEALPPASSLGSGT